VHDPLVFRGQVEWLRIEARIEEQSRWLLVDLDYTYAVHDTEGASRAVNHNEPLAGVVGILEAKELGSVETGVWRVGEHVLEKLPAVREVTVRATDQSMLEAHAVAGFKVIRTFR
jgi:dihydroneopterin aldolase